MVRPHASSLREVAAYFARLGWLAFGGPIGQIGLMHLDVVERRRWMTDDEFVRALNFCHVLPGPEALQLAILIGWRRRGTLGGVVAGALFILPGYLTLATLAWIYARHGADPRVLGVLSGFRPVALALLLAALLRIARATLRGKWPLALAAASFAAFALAHAPFIAVLLGAGLAHLALRGAKGAAAAAGVAALTPEAWQRLAEISTFFLKVGLFSFGGAYAVLPYIRAGAVLDYGWIGDAQMVDALALGETTPGPLISIGVFVGFLAGDGAGVPWLGATAAAFWLFLPSFVFVLGTASRMDALLARPGVQPFLTGVTSAVVGVMFAVAIPLARAALAPDGALDPATLALGIAAFVLLTVWKRRFAVVAVVLGGGALGLLRALAM